MPETYGLPEDEEPGPTLEARVVEAFAGTGIVRRHVLYVVACAGVVLTLAVDGVLGVIGGGAGLIALLMLSMTDRSLNG